MNRGEGGGLGGMALCPSPACSAFMTSTEDGSLLVPGCLPRAQALPSSAQASLPQLGLYRFSTQSLSNQLYSARSLNEETGMASGRLQRWSKEDSLSK